MGSKSSESGPSITLPKGGGALQGIGEKFSPDLHTGTGNFTIPVALPPGRNGFQPQLNLVYSTGTGAGPFGLGWNLSIPGVSRKTSKGIPRYDDNSDVFVLSGAEDLVPVEEQERTTRYRPRTEGLFARILHHRDADNDHWEVRSKDGLVSFYGTPKPTMRARIGAIRPSYGIPTHSSRIIYSPGNSRGPKTPSGTGSSTSTHATRVKKGPITGTNSI
jgi:virulence plasmid B protein